MAFLRMKRALPEHNCLMRIVTRSSSFAYVEAYKALRTNLNYVAQSGDVKSKVIMITSSTPAEGKSNVSVNLSISLAQEGKKVILLDCDLRKGTLHRYLRVPGLVGITSFLAGKTSLEECISHIDEAGIDLLPVGALPTNPSELLGGEPMAQLLSQLAEMYDYVLCDTPPVNAVTDAVALSRYVDGVVLVVSHQQVSRGSALAAKKQLESNNVPILGAILNMYDVRKASDDAQKVYSYYNYGYGYGYGYGEEVSAQGGEKNASKPTEGKKHRDNTHGEGKRPHGKQA